MKLIEAEKVKDVIHEYFKSLMINGASGTDVDRLAVGIGSCLKHDANLLKAIDELPSAEPERTGRWILEQLRKAVLDGKIKVNTNRYGHIQLIDIETGTMIVIGNIGGEEE